MRIKIKYKDEIYISDEIKKEEEEETIHVVKQSLRDRLDFINFTINEGKEHVYFNKTILKESIITLINK